jgi:methionine sulfoxide reductase heme-binding subunit
MAGLTLTILPWVGVISHLPSLSSAAATSPTLWYLTRTTAVAAYVALTFSVMLGLLRTIARSSAEHLSWAVDELHAFVATLAGLLVFGHLLTIKLDTFVVFSLRDLLVPGEGPYRPVAVNIGIFALYVMALALLSSWIRRFIPYRFWRALHYLSFLAFALVTIHGWLAGSDTNEPWLRALYVGGAAAVTFLTVMRLFARPRVAKQPA